MLKKEDVNFHPIYLLFKFGPKQRLDQIRDGKIYMKNLKYFVELERSTGQSGVGDINEGVLFHSTEIKMYDEQDNLVLKAPFARLSDTSSLKAPVFCITAKNIFDDIVEFDYPKVVSHIQFDKSISEDFGTDVDDFSILVIKDTNEFIDRFKTAAGKQGISIQYNTVDYRDTTVLHMKNDVISVNNAFNKNSKFKGQSEFRVLLETVVDDHMILDIGPIHDISDYIPLDILESGLRMECKAGELIEE